MEGVAPQLGSLDPPVGKDKGERGKEGETGKGRRDPPTYLAMLAVFLDFTILDVEARWH